MRFMAYIPLLLAAGCGSAGGDENKAAPKAAGLADGQWELATEVTAFRTVDQGQPAIDTPQGTRTTESVCVPAGAQAPASLFAGPGYDCRYDNYYARNGRVNVTLQCTREGLAGSIPMSVSGDFADGTLEYDRQIRTVLAGDGDVELTMRVTGRRTGECVPEAEAGNASNGNAGNGQAG